MVPIGDISVMPHACSTCSPCRFWKPSIIAGGAADPPTIICRSAFRSQRFGSLSSASRIASQTVGTPPAQVTFSSAIKLSTLTASRCGPGKTSFAPTIAAAKGIPQALTWNIGTTGRITSVSERPSAFGSAITSVCNTCERWL